MSNIIYICMEILKFKSILTFGHGIHSVVEQKCLRKSMNDRIPFQC